MIRVIVCLLAFPAAAQEVPRMSRAELVAQRNAPDLSRHGAGDVNG